MEIGKDFVYLTITYRLKKGSVRVGHIVASGGYGTVYQGWYGNLKVAIKDYVQIELWWIGPWWPDGYHGRVSVDERVESYQYGQSIRVHFA